MKYQIVLPFLLGATLLQADIIGAEAVVGYINESPSGTLQYKGSEVDVEEDFGWKEEGNFLAKVYLEHPVPVLPNLRLTYTTLKHSATNSVTNITFDNKTYSGDISTDFDTKIADLTLYYEVLDNWLNLDLGINAKYLKTTTSVSSPLLGESEADVSVVLPTLYAKAKIDVPASDFSLQAEGDIITYDSNTLYDFSLSARYLVSFGLGLEVGVKVVKFKLDDVDDLSADIDFNGVYAAIVWDL